MCWHFARIVHIQCLQPLYRLHIVIDTICGNKWTRVTQLSQGFTAGKCWSQDSNSSPAVSTSDAV